MCTVCVIDVFDQHFEIVESSYPGILVPFLVEGDFEGLLHQNRVRFAEHVVDDPWVEICSDWGRSICTLGRGVFDGPAE
jgi:hypothetical protein